MASTWKISMSTKKIKSVSASQKLSGEDSTRSHVQEKEGQQVVDSKDDLEAWRLILEMLQVMKVVGVDVEDILDRKAMLFHKIRVDHHKHQALIKQPIWKRNQLAREEEGGHQVQAGVLLLLSQLLYQGRVLRPDHRQI